MSSKLEAYEAAYERLTLEKTAEAYAEAYGTEDGYLPEAYLGAYMQLEKEAHVENMVNTFAPETGYIPAKYVSALEKEAGLMDVVRTTGSNLISGGRKALRGMKKDNLVNFTDGKYVLGPNAGLGDAAKFYFNQGKRQLGAQMVKNPGATTAVAGVGTAGAGYGGYRMLGGGK